MIEGQDGESDERLSRIEALTDTSLSQLDPDDRRGELLRRRTGVVTTQIQQTRQADILRAQPLQLATEASDLALRYDISTEPTGESSHGYSRL